MHSFSDTTGRSWSLTITVLTIKRIRAEVSLDPLAIFEPDGSVLKRLSDPCELVAVLYAACRPEAESRAVSPEQFAAAMAGDAIEAATDALLEEIVDFFPGRRRQILRRLYDQMRGAHDRALTATEMKLDDPQTIAMIERAIGSQPPPYGGDSSGNSPASPA